ALASLEQSNGSFFWVPVGNENYLIAFLREGEQTGYLRAQLEMIMRHLIEVLHTNLSFLSGAVRIYSIISDPVPRDIDFVSVFRHVCHSHISSFYDGSSRIFIGQSPPVVKLSESASAEISGRFRKVQWKADTLIGFIRDDFHKWALKQRIIPDELKNL